MTAIAQLYNKMAVAAITAIAAQCCMQLAGLSEIVGGVQALALQMDRSYEPVEVTSQISLRESVMKKSRKQLWNSADKILEKNTQAEEPEEGPEEEQEESEHQQEDSQIRIPRKQRTAVNSERSSRSEKEEEESSCSVITEHVKKEITKPVEEESLKALTGSKRKRKSNLDSSNLEEEIQIQKGGGKRRKSEEKKKEEECSEDEEKARLARLHLVLGGDRLLGPLAKPFVTPIDDEKEGHKHWADQVKEVN
jgi:hypothetical protein